ncbi:uncharacterized protein FOMMEDRAFT_140699 [Fomitiporia mediterranea MF3/22]|uniref:uncharacterized protein n=1 Tax=Fomitiporia mediterranea (strain MF3/22) TaxID=694068 RepID=UPI0004408824|nr:uncharacterized protein FOMMEDRAFT_140699 [Fomitiporia mediterranea MF3/22]EJD02875.1 hypothetical protein FOMMEDRAFT_140699 [Fomitiporia mediterranea MF3/22]
MYSSAAADPVTRTYSASAIPNMRHPRRPYFPFFRTIRVKETNNRTIPMGLGSSGRISKALSATGRGPAGLAGRNKARDRVRLCLS